jgi:hypothetical protein
MHMQPLQKSRTGNYTNSQWIRRWQCARVSGRQCRSKKDMQGTHATNKQQKFVKIDVLNARDTDTQAARQAHKKGRVALICAAGA